MLASKIFCNHQKNNKILMKRINSMAPNSIINLLQEPVITHDCNKTKRSCSFFLIDKLPVLHGISSPQKFIFFSETHLCIGSTIGGEVKKSIPLPRRLKVSLYEHFYLSKDQKFVIFQQTQDFHPGQPYSPILVYHIESNTLVHNKRKELKMCSKNGSEYNPCVGECKYFCDFIVYSSGIYRLSTSEILERVRERRGNQLVWIDTTSYYCVRH